MLCPPEQNQQRPVYWSYNLAAHHREAHASHPLPSVCDVSALERELVKTVGGERRALSEEQKRRLKDPTAPRAAPAPPARAATSAAAAPAAAPAAAAPQAQPQPAAPAPAGAPAAPAPAAAPKRASPAQAVPAQRAQRTRRNPRGEAA